MRNIIVFDVDGTLLKGEQEAAAYVSAFERCYGITGINTDWQSYRRFSDEGIAREILDGHFGRECEESELAKILDTYTSLLHDITPEVIPGIHKVLERLAERDGTGFALATGNWESTARLRLEKAGLWRYFRCGGFSEDGYGKTVILGWALDKCRRTWPDFELNADVVYVGDSVSDSIAARMHGTQFIGIGRFEETFRNRDVTHVFPDYTDIEGFTGAVEEKFHRPE